jgi:uncharacterized protein YndB with AHSA1/START domain
MTDAPITHHTFTIDRVYPADAARVFLANSEYAAKRRWFAEGDGFEVLEYRLDFREGGLETARFIAPGGVHVTYDAVFRDIVPDKRIVATYEMSIEGTRISVSIATTELETVDGGTRLVFTEQGAYIGGEDQTGSREEGSRSLLEALGRELER